MKRVIIAGSRHFQDYALLERKLNVIFLNSHAVQVAIVSGCCKGADTLGERYARERGMNLIQVPAQWEAYGKQAGYLRNVLMASIATHLVAFWEERWNQDDG